jgi:hypothetical protein
MRCPAAGRPQTHPGGADRAARGTVLAWILICLVGCVVFLAGCASADDGAQRDRKLVLCLSGSGRSGVVDAAVALGLGQRAEAVDQILVNRETLTLENWRSGHPQEFSRACEAYVAATQSQDVSNGVGSGTDWNATVVATVLSLLVALITAFVGGLVTVWVSGAEGRRKLARELRAKAHEFRDVGEEYVRSFSGDGPPLLPDDLFASKQELVGVLREVEAAHQYWRVVPAVREELDAAPLADSAKLDRDMNSPSETTARAAAERVDAVLQQRTMDTLRLATAMESPLASLRKLRSGQVSVLRTRRTRPVRAVDRPVEAG